METKSVLIIYLVLFIKCYLDSLLMSKTVSWCRYARKSDKEKLTATHIFWFLGLLFLYTYNEEGSQYRDLLE